MTPKQPIPAAGTQQGRNNGQGPVSSPEPRWDRWSPRNYRVLMADPEGYAKVCGIALGDLACHIGLTHFVDVTHLATGRKLASMRTLGGAVAFVEDLYYNCPWATDKFAEAEPRLTLAQAGVVRDLIAKHREAEQLPTRESL